MGTRFSEDDEPARCLVSLKHHPVTVIPLSCVVGVPMASRHRDARYWRALKNRANRSRGMRLLPDAR